MDFWTLANAAVSGLLIGLVYGLSALGLSVIFGVIRVVNFAHGEIMVMGMFFALVMFQWLGIDPLLSVPLAAGLMFMLAGGTYGNAATDWLMSRPTWLWGSIATVLVVLLLAGYIFGISLIEFAPVRWGLPEFLRELLNHLFDAVVIVLALLFIIGGGIYGLAVRRVSHLPEHMQFLLLAAIAIMIVSALLLVFGPDAQGVQVGYAWDSFAVSELIIDYPKAFAAVAAMVVAGLLLAFFKYSATGKAIRACADNYMGAQVVGLNVGRLYALTFGVGAACLGAAGAIILLLIEVHPYLAPGYTLLAFVIVIIGGLGSLFGALLGGILIGVSEAMAAILFQPSMKTAFSFGLLIIVLLLRPQGLLGKAVR